MQSINITSPRAQRALRAWSAISGTTALLFAFVAYGTLYGRGLLETGLQILLCIGTAKLGWFGYTQPAFPRDWILLGTTHCSSRHAMLEPAWPLITVASTAGLAIYIIATA